MRYKLIVYCDCCGKKGQARLAKNGVVPPGGWGYRTWPSGEQTLVCSKPCSADVDLRRLRESIVVKKIGQQ